MIDFTQYALFCKQTFIFYCHMLLYAIAIVLTLTNVVHSVNVMLARLDASAE